MAQALLVSLENLGQPCWLASRDVPVGGNFAQAIAKGIREARAVALLLSEQAFASPHVQREVCLAVDSAAEVYPLSIGQAVDAGKLPGEWGYWLSLLQIHQIPTAEQAAQIMFSKLGATESHTLPVSRQDEPLTTGLPEAPPIYAAPPVDARLRSALIDVAASGNALSIAETRARRFGYTPEQVRAAAVRLREANLLAFDGDPDPTTTIHLT